MGRLVRFAAENADADRCTLTSLDQHVLRVEASYERGGPPDFVGQEYPMSWLQRQPLLERAVITGTIVLGGSFGDDGDADPDLAASLLEMRHIAIVPLSVGDAVGAVLILSRRSDRPFAPRELTGLQQAGPLAVLALRNARLVEQVRSAQRRGLDSLTQMSRDVATSVDPAAFFEKMSETVAGLVTAERAVIASVTPTQLYERLLDESEVPATVIEGARRFRYGRAEMQIHFALSEPARWEGDERLGRTAIVHVTPGLDGVSRAVNEAERSLLPAEATIVVGQPLTIDPSRAPDGKGILWIQLQELPRVPKGDAAGAIDVGDGIWNDELRERYADRIQERLARHLPNLESSILQRVVLGPHDLERMNVNLRHGDPYGGALSLDQNFLWRPFPRAPGHATAVERLFHIGASTWPGPGLGAGSGTLVAQELLKPPLSRRAVAKLRAVAGR